MFIHMRAENDRDERVVGYASAKGLGRARLEPVTPGGHRDTAWGGAMARHASDHGGMLLGREYVAHTAPGGYEKFSGRDHAHHHTHGAHHHAHDTHYASHGDYMRLGYARYNSATVNVHDYRFYRIAGWRVAIPRAAPGFHVRGVLSRIFEYGPQAAGYVRLGDTLVPAELGPGDRAVLAGAGSYY